MINKGRKLGKEKSLVLLLAVFTLILPLFSTSVAATNNWSVSSQTDWEGTTSSKSGTMTKRGTGELELAPSINWDNGEIGFDGFEDGDISEWSDDTGTFYTDNNVAAEGDYSVGVSNDGDISRYFPSQKIYHISWFMRNSDSVGDGGNTYLHDSSGNNMFLIRFVDADISYRSGGTDHQIKDTTTNTWYKVTVKNIDWSSETFDIYIDGNLEASDVGFRDSVSDVTRLRLVKGNSNDAWWDSFHIGSYSDSGTWTSQLWDAGTSTQQKLDSLDINDTIGTDETVEVRLSVDENDDGVIEKTSSWVSLSDGTNSLSASDFDIDTSGYRYQVGFNLSVTDGDTSHSPSVSGFGLSTYTAVDANDLECFNGSSWSSCTQFTEFNSKIEKMRVNCTTSSGDITETEISLADEYDDNYRFKDKNFTSVDGDWYIYDNPDQEINDSGGWNASARCYSSGWSNYYEESWSVPWGSLSVSLDQPASDIEVTQNETFTMSGTVTCSGGECASEGEEVNIYADPRKEKIATVENMTAGETVEFGPEKKDRSLLSTIYNTLQRWFGY